MQPDMCRVASEPSSAVRTAGACETLSGRNWQKEGIAWSTDIGNKFAARGTWSKHGGTAVTWLILVRFVMHSVATNRNKFISVSLHNSVHAPTRRR